MKKLCDPVSSVGHDWGGTISVGWREHVNTEATRPERMLVLVEILTCVYGSLSLSGYFNFLCLYLCTTPVTSGFLILEPCVFLVVICVESCCTSSCPLLEFLSFDPQLICFLLFSDYLLSYN